MSQGVVYRSTTVDGSFIVNTRRNGKFDLTYVSANACSVLEVTMVVRNSTVTDRAPLRDTTRYQRVYDPTGQAQEALCLAAAQVG